jgi:hypothetical protein
MQTSKTDMTLPLEPETEAQSSLLETVVVGASPFYQANGVIEAELERDESGKFSLQWQDKSWPISFMGGNKLGKVKTLVGQRLYWRVYPTPAWTEQGFMICRFTVVSQPKNPGQLKDGEFTLSGCWQALPQWGAHPVRQAYFSVYRNRDGRMTAQNIYYSNYALNWEEPPFVPTDEHKAPWHSIVASLQQDGVFNFVRLLDGPKPAPFRVRRAAVEPSVRPDGPRSVVNHRPRLKSAERPDVD